MVETLISILLPTRGRRELAEKFISSALSQAARPELIEFLLYVDNDDPESAKIFVEDAKLEVILGERARMGECNLECLRRSKGQIIVFGNDDVEIKTQDWDEKIIQIHNSYADAVYLAYPNDLYKGKTLSAFPILSKKVLSLLADPAIGWYSGAFIDTHLMEVFIRLRAFGENRIKYLEDVIFEHMHFRAGKGKVDQTYIDRDRFSDDMTFLALAEVRKSSAEGLFNVIRNRATSYVIEYAKPHVPSGRLPFFQMVAVISKCMLKDTGLPISYRVKFFVYMVGRYVFFRFS